ncbi:unnamed protein product, partial [Sphagnum jensenii]
MKKRWSLFLRLSLLTIVYGLLVLLLPQFTGRTYGETLGSQSELTQYLKAFYADTASTMNAIPAKYDSSGKIVLGNDTPFYSLDEKFKYYQSQRAEVFQTDSLMPSAPRSNDLVENLVDVPNIIRTLQAMEDEHLTSQDLANKPWSDSYWPDAHGMIAVRYADPSYPMSSDWQTNLNYTLDNPAAAILASGKTDNLAPSEKYDALVGDSQGTLTQQTWGTIRALGDVASWEGICDGWSAGSVSYPEPIHAITVTGAGSTQIRFFPSDVKALSAILWSKGSYTKKFIGSICDQENPEKDDNGRVIAPECQGSNPGTWHMAVVNQLGQAKRALIIDASNDNQIWNFPMWHYDYSYFNPQTLQPMDHWRDAVLPYDQFTIDKFKSYRSPNVKYVVGISMNISYMIEVTPTHNDGA